MKISAVNACNYLFSRVFMVFFALMMPALANAGVYSSDTEVTYKEYWVSHDEFVGGCDTTPPTFYIEPGAASCPSPDREITVNLDIPDLPSSAIKAEIYLDLWRNRDNPSARFTLNGNATVYNPGVGSDWSRTPYVGDVTLSELVQGNNTIRFTAASGLYHVHDIAIRLYYDGANPLTPGAGSDVTAPTGALTAVAGGDPTVAAVLNVDSNSLPLSATAADDVGVAYVEFHGYYYGYDEDNDGVFRDWHNATQSDQLAGPVFVQETIDHIGTDTTAPYSKNWGSSHVPLSHIPNQSGVKFKVRIVDTSGNVREAAGGVSAEFTLSRTSLVESHLIYKFEDMVLHHDGTFPDTYTQNIILPNDISDVTAAYLVEAFWRNPSISFNGNTAFDAFASCATSHCWELAARSIPVSDLVGGSNQIEYNYSGAGFGEFIEKPGPMIILVRDRSPAPATGFVADGFGAPALNTDLWSFFDAVGDSTLAMTGTQAEISVPGGVTHNLWNDANDAPRILQPAADTDFEIEVKFDSGVTLDSQFQGIIVQEDVNEFIRFGIYSDGTNTRRLGATFVDGVPTNQINENFQSGGGAVAGPLYMRVRRVGDDWTQTISTDGVTFVRGRSFTHAISVRDVGLHAGNAVTDPAHTATFDYFGTTTVSIVTDPQDASVNEGDTATFTVEALGAAPLAYQWQLDSGSGFSNIGGAVGSSYTTPVIALADSGNSYRVAVTNVTGTVNSNAATLTVNVAPSITTQPVSQSVNEGGSATFTVTATGTPAPTYQWKKDGSDISGETGSSLTIDPVAVADGGDYTVVVTNVAGSVTSDAATLTVTAAAGTSIVSSVLPSSRSVQVGDVASAFATIINAGTEQATVCSIAPSTAVAADFSYQTTDPVTNVPTGSPDTPVNIAAGAAQSFVFYFTPNAAFSPTDVELDFDCSNTDSAAVNSGLNTLLLSADSAPVPDVVALAVTPSGDGVLHLPSASGSGAFAVATVNVGSSSTITVSADTGSALLPVSTLVCETNSSTGACLATPASTVTTTIGPGATPTFAVFATAAGAIPFDPANNRIFVRFKDGGNVIRGSTSVALETL